MLLGMWSRIFISLALLVFSPDVYIFYSVAVSKVEFQNR